MPNDDVMAAKSRVVELFEPAYTTPKVGRIGRVLGVLLVVEGVLAGLLAILLGYLVALEVEPFRADQSLLALEENISTSIVVLTILGVLVLAGTGVIWMVWQGLAHRNLIDLGVRTRSAWAVLWWLVPVAHLFMPFRAVRELWQASTAALADEGSNGSENLGIWWFYWVVHLLLTAFGSVPNIPVQPLWLATGYLSLAVAARFAYLVAKRITAGQVLLLGGDPEMLKSGRGSLIGGLAGVLGVLAALVVLAVLGRPDPGDWPMGRPDPGDWPTVDAYVLDIMETKGRSEEAGMLAAEMMLEVRFGDLTGTSAAVSLFDMSDVLAGERDYYDGRRPPAGYDESHRLLLAGLEKQAEALRISALGLGTDDTSEIERATILTMEARRLLVQALEALP